MRRLFVLATSAVLLAGVSALSARAAPLELAQISPGMSNQGMSGDRGMMMKKKKMSKKQMMMKKKKQMMMKKKKMMRDNM